MGSKHVAKSGALAGKWVACSAVKECRNGGTHVSSEVLRKAQEQVLKETGVRVRLGDLSLKSVLWAEEDVKFRRRMKAIEDGVVLDYIYGCLDHNDWKEYGEKVRSLVSSMTKKYGAPMRGRCRAVFDLGDGTVMKIPFTDEGELANGDECRAAKMVDPYIPVAECDYRVVDGVDVLIMEKVRMVKVDYKLMPDWVGSVDCGQVGLNRKGELVAYDL